MQTHIVQNKIQENLTSGNSTIPPKQDSGTSIMQLKNDSLENKTQDKLQELTKNSSKTQSLAQLQSIANSTTIKQNPIIQKKVNKTGLPDHLKNGIENLSGISMDDVKVHYNSSRPAQLQAHAYAQGNNIHVATGQEKHLAHEAWHVVQQKQGRVKPTMQLQGLNINDNVGLEREADRMGNRALQMKSATPVQRKCAQCGGNCKCGNKKTEEPITPLKKKVVQRKSISHSTPVIQLQIGPHGDGKKVINVKTLQVYVAKANTIGSYDLYIESNGAHSFRINVDPNDPDYELLDDFLSSHPQTAEQFSIRSEYPRVYTDLPIAEKEEDMTVLHSLGPGPTGDFSYSDTSRALTEALSQKPEEEAAAIRAGTALELEDGALELDPELDPNLQLIAHHLLQYQNMHTPPNLQGKSQMGDLPGYSVKQENEWRQGELDLTKEWMNLLGAEGLRSMLPEMPDSQEDVQNEPSSIFPGPLDITFPPNESRSLFTYPDRAAVYVLNKRVLLDAYLRKQSEEGASSSKLDTDAFMDMVRTQEGSTAINPEEYIRQTLRLRRSDSEDSLDFTDSEEDEDVSRPMMYDPSDNLQTASNKRRTLLNAMGTQSKLLNRKILQDKAEIIKAKEGRKRLVRRKNVGRLLRAKKSRDKHQRILARLDDRHGELKRRFHPPFRRIRKQKEKYDEKSQLIKKLVPKTQEEKGIKRKYEDHVESYYTEIPGGKRKKSSGPLPDIGETTLKNAMKGKQQRLIKHRITPQDVAERNGGGTLEYGNSDGNNCLIFAIGYALTGSPIPPALANQIRQNILQGNHAGVNADGYLPGYQRVINHIMQLILGQMAVQGIATHPITVVVDTILPGIAPVVVGNGATRVVIIHDGNHYWWLRQ